MILASIGGVPLAGPYAWFSSASVAITPRMRQYAANAADYIGISTTLLLLVDTRTREAMAGDTQALQGRLSAALGARDEWEIARVWAAAKYMSQYLYDKALQLQPVKVAALAIEWPTIES